MNVSSRRYFTRLLGAALVCAAAGCSGLGPTEAGDVSPAIGPPPRQWKAAIAFFLDDSTQVEFFDGVRTRVVTSREGMEAAFGRTPWYRVHLGDTLTTVLDVKVVFPGGAGTATAEYPLTAQRGAFHSVRINTSGFNARWIVGALGARAYPIPAAAQKTPSDSLWIYWAARSRDCWTCPS